MSLGLYAGILDGVRINALCWGVMHAKRCFFLHKQRACSPSNESGCLTEPDTHSVFAPRCITLSGLRSSRHVPLRGQHQRVSALWNNDRRRRLVVCLSPCQHAC